MLDMAKITTTKPVLILLYGFPGAGKTQFALQLCEQMVATHVHDDRIREDLFETPTYSKDESHIVSSLMAYMAGEFLRAGVSVVFDTNAMRLSQRKALRALAKDAGAEVVLLWFQIDSEGAYARASHRDRRRVGDRHARRLNRNEFDEIIRAMQNPEGNEGYQVISGKHTFGSQKTALVRHLLDRRLILPNQNTAHIAKPALVNMVPHPSEGSRRNINVIQ